MLKAGRQENIQITKHKKKILGKRAYTQPNTIKT